MKNTTMTAVLLAAGSCVPAFAQPFTPVGIGNLQGGPSVAYSITSWAGPNYAVVGETDTNNSLTHKACTFTTGMLAINNGSGPGGNFFPKVAYRINHAPNILIHVGSGQSAALATRAFRTNGGLTFELGTISPLLQNSEARGVNVHGVVVGTCWAMNSFPGSGNNNSFAFQWVPAGGPADNNGTMSMIPLHAAYDVNDSGVAVGSISGAPYRLVIATNTLTNLGSFGAQFGSGVATSINNAGVIVGFSPAPPTNLQHAFRSTGSGLQDIHPAVLIGSGGGASYAFDVADGTGPSALIVGQFHGPNTGSNGHAFVYNPATGVFRNLNTWLPPNSGWVLEAAYGINDAHCVVGRGRRNGQLEGFRMCIVPPQPPQAPCPPGPLNPIPSQALCPGGTAVFHVDPTPVGGMPAEIEWSAARRVISSNDFHHNRIVDGVNTDPSTGEPLFMAAIEAGGRQVSLTPIPGPGTVPQIGDALIVTALVRGPCDTLYAPAATAMLSPADIGVQGGGPGKDGMYDNNDFVSFIDLFFLASVAADIGSQGGVIGSDGMHDNNDFVVFIDEFFQACS